jgi:catechol 2,3-dioxygenase-like lactoylglutathione lyase family enzyme
MNDMATVRIFVNDVVQARPFYEALGFEQKEDHGPVIAIMGKGDLTVWLAGPGTSAARPWQDGTQPVPGGYTRIVLPMDVWEANRKKLESLGGRLVNGPLKGPGGTQIVVLDPDGNSIEFFQP